MQGSTMGWLTLCGVFLLLACAPRDPRSSGDAAASPLVTSLEAEPRDGAVHFRLQVTNASDGPVTLNFSSGQRFDFAVRRGEQEVWRWSADQMFTQALGAETLPAGETRRFEAVWTPPAGTSGEYEVTGTLTARERSVQQSTRFRLP